MCSCTPVEAGRTQLAVVSVHTAVGRTSMDDEALREPFMADQEGWGFDEALLQELAALDAAEAGGGFAAVQPDGHVEDTDVYRMKELTRYT